MSSSSSCFLVAGIAGVCHRPNFHISLWCLSLTAWFSIFSVLVFFFSSLFITDMSFSSSVSYLIPPSFPQRLTQACLPSLIFLMVVFDNLRPEFYEVQLTTVQNCTFQRPLSPAGRAQFQASWPKSLPEAGGSRVPQFLPAESFARLNQQRALGRCGTPGWDLSQVFHAQ